MNVNILQFPKIITVTYVPEWELVFTSVYARGVFVTYPWQLDRGLDLEAF